MIKKIERPDWRKASGYPLHPDMTRSLDEWFDTHVEPINKAIENGVVVESENRPYWVKDGIYDQNKNKVSTHRALLIGVEEIKKETAEDILRDWSKWIESEVDIFKPMSGKAAEFYERAKALLEKSEGEG